MPSDISSNPNAEYNVQIPSFDENADIQTAFKLYHYGDNQSGVGTLDPDSIAGFLKALETSKISKTPTPIPLNANLNNFTESGFYAQFTDAGARSGSNYPRIPPPPSIGFEYAGILRVVNDGNGSIYQEYQIGSIPGQSVYWRAKFGNLSFSPWQGFSVEGHIHDDRYFTKTQADNRYFPAIKYLTIRQPSLTNNGYTLSLLDENSLVMIDNLSIPNTVTIPNNNSVAFVLGTQITILQKNTGQTTIAGASGVNVRFTPSNKLRAIFSSASLIKIGTNEWVVIGDLA